MAGNLSASSTQEIFSLSRIRDTLVRLEDTIIFFHRDNKARSGRPALIERAQFALNPKIYERNAFEVLHRDGFQGSWLEWFLRQTEVMHAKVRRFASPDEHPFTDRNTLPEPLLPPVKYPATLHPNNVNVNDRILAFYVDAIVPAITLRASTTSANDDENYGSSATRDVEALQAISRRVHYGMFVAESKFRECPANFVPHIITPDSERLLSFITKPEVEAALLVRLARKAALYGQDIDAAGHPVPSNEKTKVDVDEVVKIYRDYIIPLTKEVEVQYLLHRLHGLSQDDIDTLAKRQQPMQV